MSNSWRGSVPGLGLLEASSGNLRFADWLFRAKAASVLWLAVRLWLGYEWLNAGYQKLWGSENAGFWNHDGIAVKKYAAASIAGSATGKGGASYGWWAAFLHNFVIPNAGWIAKFISIAEFLIGILLIAGLFTGLAAAGGVALNMIYMLSGTAGVNPVYAFAGMFLILAWRNAGYLGLDRFIFPWIRHHLRSAQPSEPVVVTPTGAVPT
ncbi:MAG TPA: DoxX family protein [Acidimicrobiales bacterium]|nr:DoxX family protein [Acidimicrobiales bacterium]HXZ62988.1 DoxX family protein [Acidimicrobiales bacterium]